MDCLRLLNEARAAGLTVAVEGELLRIKGPRRAEPIVQRLIAHKEAVLHTLSNDLLGLWRIDLEERAAIMEFDGLLPREHAEARALIEIVEAMRRAGVFRRTGPTTN